MKQRASRRGQCNTWLVISLALLAFMLGGAIFVIGGIGSAFEDEVTPFRETQTLSNGTRLTVEGKISAGFAGTGTEYKLWIQMPGQPKELVDNQNLIGRRQNILPSDTARLISQHNQQFLTLGEYIYWREPHANKRSAESPVWKSWSYDSLEVKCFGRALMPKSFARYDDFSWMQGLSDNNFPSPPAYSMKMLDGKRHVLILNRGEPNEYNQAKLWPGQLVFTSSDHEPNTWRLNLKRTQSLKGSKPLKPLPHNVQAEILVMKLPDNYWESITRTDKNGSLYHDYDSLPSLPGAEVLQRQQFILTSNLHSIELPSWWNQGSHPVKLKIRGVCSDPNPTLFHLKWQINNEPDSWIIARDGYWLELREGMCALESPYVFIRVKHISKS